MLTTTIITKVWAGAHLNEEYFFSFLLYKIIIIFYYNIVSASVDIPSANQPLYYMYISRNNLKKKIQIYYDEFVSVTVAY